MKTPFAQDTAIPKEKLMQFILLFFIVTVPAIGNYLELLDEQVRDTKIEHLGIFWVLGYAGFSIAAMVLGLYLIFNNALRVLLFGVKDRDPS